MWWRRREQPVRLGAWYAMNGITNIFGSLLTYGIGHIHSTRLNSYQVGDLRATPRCSLTDDIADHLLVLWTDHRGLLDFCLVVAA